MTATDRSDIQPPDHDERMRVAEEVAAWSLGSRAWAREIVGAYLYPDAALENLQRERGEDA